MERTAQPEPDQTLKDAVVVWRAAEGDQNARRRAKRRVEKLCKEQGIDTNLLLYSPRIVTEEMSRASRVRLVEQAAARRERDRLRRQARREAGRSEGA